MNRRGLKPFQFGNDLKTRSNVEKWLDKHKRKMEFIRTLTSVLAAVASSFVLFKVW